MTFVTQLIYASLWGCDAKQKSIILGQINLLLWQMTNTYS